MNGIQQWGGYGGQQLAPQGLLGGLLGIVSHRVLCRKR